MDRVLDFPVAQGIVGWTAAATGQVREKNPFTTGLELPLDIIILPNRVVLSFDMQSCLLHT